MMSDNGILNGEHGMVDKRTAHEPSMRILQIVRFPGLTPVDKPRKIDQQVLTVDMAPGLLELCGRAATGTDPRTFMGAACATG
jgi:N-acetylglucosamine-6-sulfatase